MPCDPATPTETGGKSLGNEPLSPPPAVCPPGPSRADKPRTPAGIGSVRMASRGHPPGAPRSTLTKPERVVYDGSRRESQWKDAKRGQPVLMCPTAFWLLLLIELVVAVGGNVRMYGEHQTRCGVERKAEAEGQVKQMMEPVGQSTEGGDATNAEPMVVERKMSEAADLIACGETCCRIGEWMLAAGSGSRWCS